MTTVLQLWYNTGNKRECGNETHKPKQNTNKESEVNIMGDMKEIAINVEEYLMDCARDLQNEDYELIRDPDDIELVCEDIIILYAHARGYEVIRQHRQFAESFYEWTQGLPYNFFDYHYYDPRPTYKELFGERKEIYDDLCEENEDIRSKITFTILDTILLHVENVHDLIKKNTR